MLDDRKRAEMDQAIAAMAEIWPRCWRVLYNGLVAEGFSKDQAFLLLQTYVAASSGGRFPPPENTERS